MLRAKSISKFYGKKAAIQDISVTLEPGSLKVVLGPSGSGKSSLIRLLSFLEPPTSGQITLENEEFSTDSKSLRSLPPWPKLTVVFQEHFLWPHRTLRDNILLPHRPISSFSQDQFDQIASRFQMEEFLDRFPNEVSMGQRQRTALVRALMLKPKYLLLDEITASLDVEQAGNILHFFMETWDGSFAAFLVTHHLGFARNILKTTDNATVAFLDDGRIVEEGTSDILENPRSNRLQQFLEAGKNLE